eukprot:scaffold19_cov114-Cylindrotheca_fusiformis.AAC.40
MKYSIRIPKRSIMLSVAMLAMAESWKSSNTHTSFIHLRGGRDNEELIDDRDLDAYIDFLLAQADDKPADHPFLMQQPQESPETTENTGSEVGSDSGLLEENKSSSSFSETAATTPAPEEPEFVPGPSEVDQAFSSFEEEVQEEENTSLHAEVSDDEESIAEGQDGDDKETHPSLWNKLMGKVSKATATTKDVDTATEDVPAASGTEVPESTAAVEVSESVLESSSTMDSQVPDMDMHREEEKEDEALEVQEEAFVFDSRLLQEDREEELSTDREERNERPTIDMEGEVLLESSSNRVEEEPSVDDEDLSVSGSELEKEVSIEDIEDGLDGTEEGDPRAGDAMHEPSSTLAKRIVDADESTNSAQASPEQRQSLILEPEATNTEDAMPTDEATGTSSTESSKKAPMSIWKKIKLSVGSTSRGEEGMEESLPADNGIGEEMETSQTEDKFTESTAGLSSEDEYEESEEGVGARVNEPSSTLARGMEEEKTSNSALEQPSPQDGQFLTLERELTNADGTMPTDETTGTSTESSEKEPMSIWNKIKQSVGITSQGEEDVEESLPLDSGNGEEIRTSQTEDKSTAGFSSEDEDEESEEDVDARVGGMMRDPSSALGRDVVEEETSKRAPGQASLGRRPFLTLEPEFTNTDDIMPRDEVTGTSTESSKKAANSIWKNVRGSAGSTKQGEEGMEESLPVDNGTGEERWTSPTEDKSTESTPVPPKQGFGILQSTKSVFDRSYGALKTLANKKSVESPEFEEAERSETTMSEAKPARDYSKIYVKYFETPLSADVPGVESDSSATTAAEDSNRGWGSWARKFAFPSRKPSVGSDENFRESEDSESDIDPAVEFESDEDAMSEESLGEDIAGSSNLLDAPEIESSDTNGSEDTDHFDFTEEAFGELDSPSGHDSVDDRAKGEAVSLLRTKPTFFHKSIPTNRRVLTLEKEDPAQESMEEGNVDDILDADNPIGNGRSACSGVPERSDEPSNSIVKEESTKSNQHTTDYSTYINSQQTVTTDVPTRKWFLTLEADQDADADMGSGWKQDSNDAPENMITDDVDSIDIPEKSERVGHEDGLADSGSTAERTTMEGTEDEQESQEIVSGKNSHTVLIAGDSDELSDQYEVSDEEGEGTEELDLRKSLSNDDAPFSPAEIDEACNMDLDNGPAFESKIDGRPGNEEGAVEVEEEEADSNDSEVVEEDEPSSYATVKLTELKPELLKGVPRFLVKNGLESLLMLSIAFIEWFKIYMYPPLGEIFDWVFEKQPPPLLRGDSLLSKVFSTRGGASETPSDEDGKESDILDEGSSHQPATGSSVLSAQENGDLVEERGKESESKTMHGESKLEDVFHSNATEPSDGLVGKKRARPNLLYRFLLGYGYPGHSVIMFSVFGVEWVSTYLPIVISLLKLFQSQVLRGGNGLTEQDDPFVSQTTGFVDESGSVVRGGKKRKSQIRRDDQKALVQLKRIGDITQARYRFVSDSFMRRHAIGQYAGELAFVDVEETMVKPLHSEESDDDWVAKALDQNISEEARIDPFVGVSYGSNGASISAGIELASGGSKRKKRKRPLVSEVARQTYVSSKPKKPKGPRVSDRESGMMGRIRAAGANSLVGRSILGAYPGDVPAPYDAADPEGMIDLATRYGYGDWSEDDNGIKRTGTKRKKKRSSSKRHRGSDGEDRLNHVGIGFEFGSRSSQQIPRSPTRHKTTRSPEAVAEGMLTESRVRRKRRSISGDSRSKSAQHGTTLGPALDYLKNRAAAESEKRSSDSAKTEKKSKRPQQELERKDSVLGPAMDMLDKRSNKDS